MKDDAVAVLVGEALGSLAGPVLLLDEQLRVRFASEAAAEVLGAVVPLGVAAPSWLCGTHTKRPLAEALAAGRPVQAIIPRLDADGLVHVRSAPLRHGNKKVGWLLHLSSAPMLTGHGGPELFYGMWSGDARMKQLFRVIEKVAQDDVPVLVRGETGTGKELVATALHLASPRRDGPFRAINCAALPPNLLESELFGHARGAFTGAVKAMPGHMQLAHRGTLFLDEVAEVPLELQAKLLRVIETRQVIPVGAREPIPIDIRIVSATHRALREEVDAGRFRGDLMYRLRVIPLFLPALRERPGDVALLADKFIAEMNPSKRREIKTIQQAALRALTRYEWPGNVRELRSALAYAYAIGDGEALAVTDLPPEIAAPELGSLADLSALPTDTPPAIEDAARDPEATRIQRALQRAGGRRDQAAKLLGMSRVTLWRRMRDLGL